MTSRLHRRLAGLGAVLALLALVVGVPVLLVAVAGWPFPTDLPDWSTATRAISQGDIPASTVLKGLAVVVWIIWLQVMWALVWELAVNLPRLDRGQRPRCAPLVVAPVGSGIGRLVTLVLAAGIAVTSAPSAAIALPTPTSVVAPTTTSGSFAPVKVEAPSAERRTAPTWVVKHQDSLWRIAETTLGDGQRSREILELNPWLQSARNLKAGQVLTLPASAQMPADRTASLPTGPMSAVPAPTQVDASITPADESGYVPLAQVVIQSGDTLWDLAEERLELVDDDVTPSKVVEHLDAIIIANPDVVEDPNLIYPGETFTLPAIGTAPALPVVGTPLPDPAMPTSSNPVLSRVPEVVAPADEAEPTEPSTIPSRSPSPVVTAPAYIEAASADVPAAEAHGRPASVAPWLAGISGATALASALLLLYRRRLAVRAARGARALRAAVPDDPTVLNALTRAADIGLVRWANQQMSDLFARLEPGDVDGEPFAVELSDTHGIEILWTSPNAEPPKPWTTDATGWSWRLAYDPDQLSTKDELPAALPALVTIGTRGGNQLLLNLEATGTLNVLSDDPDAIDDFIRSLIVELAAGELLSDTYIINAGIQLDGLVHLERVHECSVDAAVERARAAAAAAADFLTTHGLANAFQARLGGDAVGRESTVLTLRSGLDVPEIQPGVGVCCVNVPSTISATHWVTLAPDGTATLHPSGLRFDPVGLPLATVEKVSDLVDEASEPFDPDTPIGEVASDIYPANLSNLEAVGELATDDAADHLKPAVLVRVLGEPEVIGHSTLGRIETSIVAYVACHGNTRRDDQVINAVWNGRAVEPKTLWNKISRIRTALGADIVPNRPPKTDEISFCERITTDLGLLQLTLRRAEQVSQGEALDLLLEALDLVAGVPFDGTNCDWAYETQDHAIACETVETAALTCVQLALELGDIDAARRALSQGLKALPLNEPLYRARMQVEAASGSPQRVRQVLIELKTALDLHRDDGFAIELERETQQLATRLAGSEAAISGAVPLST